MTATHRVMIAAAVALSACGGSKGEAPAGGTGFALLPLPDLAAVDAAAIGSADRSILSSTREASGVRELLGVTADDTFRLLGDARAAAQAAAAAELDPSPVNTTLAFARGPLALAAAAAEPPAAWVEVPLTVFMLGALQTGLARPPDTGAPPSSVQTVTTNGATSRLEYRPTITGSKVTGTVESSTTTTTSGGTAVTERFTATLEGDVCPDPQGAVPLRMNIRTSSSAGTRGYDYGLDVTATGRVDDEGNLAGYEMDLVADFTLAPGNKVQGDGLFVEFAVNEAITFSSGATPARGESRYRQTRSSSKVNDRYNQDTTRELITWARMYVIFLLYQHEGVWQEGRCVEVLVPARQRVAPASVTSFTARVRHKFENAELSVPVIATLQSGAVSVAPADTKVQAPATLVYTAPGARDLEATVKVVSRSRRGWAEALATFVTGIAGYRASGVQGDATYSGLICSLESPFEVAVAAGPGSATYSFVPTSGSAGNMTESGSYPGGIIWSGIGTYTVEGLDTSTPQIVAPFSHTTTAGGVGFTQSLTAIIDLAPAEDGACLPP